MTSTLLERNLYKWLKDTVFLVDQKNHELLLSIRRESGLKNGVAKNVDDHHRFRRLKNKAK